MKSFLLAVFLGISLLGTGQSIEQAVGLLNQNKRVEAATALQTLSGKSESAEKALLLSTVLELNKSNYDGAVEYFDRFFQQSADPYPYVYAFWTTGLFTQHTKKTAGKVDQLMKRIVSDAKAPLYLRAMATDNQGQKMENNNLFKEAKDAFKKIGDIRNWASVGVFENTSASGFNKDFGVLAHPEPGYVFTNSTGAPVSWFNIPDARNDRWLDNVYHYEISNSIIYAQTFVQSATDRDVQLLLGVSGSIKVWINDYLVLSEEEERNTDLDVYTETVKLQKGTNRILIQLGASEINSSNFMLRFADMNGQLITNLTSSQTASAYQKASPYTVTRNPFGPESFFEKKAETTSNDFLEKLMLAYVYNHNDKRFEATRIANQLKTKFPQSTIVSALLIECYNRDNNNTDLTRESESIKANDPESIFGLQLHYEEAFGKEEYDEARKYLDKRIEIYGENEETQYMLIQLLIKKNNIEAVLKELTKAFTIYPDNATFINMQYNAMLNINKNQAGADSILANYLAGHFNETLMEQLIADKMSLGKKEEALQMMVDLIDKRPYRIRQYTKLADKYFEVQDYAKAAEWEQKAIDRAPFAGEFFSSLGVINNAAGKKEEAIASFKKAISYNPSNYTARKKLSELQGKKDPFSYFKEYDIAALYKASPKADAYPNDNSIYLLKEMQQVIYPENGASEEKQQYLIKIFNQSGIDDWKEVNLSYNSYSQRLILLKADILKKDGSRVQAERNNNQLVFSSLEIGDAIYISYKLENAFSGKLSEHFWQEYSINNWYPVKQSAFSMIVPADRKFNYKDYNTDLKPVITDIEGGLKLYQWEKKDNPRIEPESNMPVFADIGQRVVISSIPDWTYVANWYYDLSTIKTKADYAIKEKVKEILKGKENASEYIKAKTIYTYIQENFNYSDVPFLHSALTPQRASRTLSSKLGDCKDLAVLFMSMTREAGLNTNLVLVDTRNEGDNNLDLPLIGFNHCIAQFKTGDKTYLIELTDNHLPFGAMSNNLINANGLYIVKDTEHKASLVKLNSDSRTGNTVTRNSLIKIKGSSASISRVGKFSGAETSGVRQSLRNQSAEDRNKRYISSLNDEFGKNVSLQGLTISNLDNLSDSISLEYDFTVDNYTSEIAGMQVLKFPWVDTYSTPGFVSLETRTFPINLWSFSTTSYDREVITLILPAGKKLVEIPKNISYNCPSLSYKLSFVVKPDRIIATREVKYLKDHVPVAEYPLFKKTINSLLEADKKQIAYK